MPIQGVTQNEDADALGNIRITYTGTVVLPEQGFTGSVTVDGGPDWADNMIAAAQAEAANVRKVADATI